MHGRERRVPGGHDEEQQHAEHHQLLPLTNEPAPQFQLYFMLGQRFAGHGELPQLVRFPRLRLYQLDTGQHVEGMAGETLGCRHVLHRGSGDALDET